MYAPTQHCDDEQYSVIIMMMSMAITIDVVGRRKDKYYTCKHVIYTPSWVFLAEEVGDSV